MWICAVCTWATAFGRPTTQRWINVCASRTTRTSRTGSSRYMCESAAPQGNRCRRGGPMCKGHNGPRGLRAGTRNCPEASDDARTARRAVRPTGRNGVPAGRTGRPSAWGRHRADARAERYPPSGVELLAGERPKPPVYTKRAVEVYDDASAPASSVARGQAELTALCRSLLRWRLRSRPAWNSSTPTSSSSSNSQQP